MEQVNSLTDWQLAEILWDARSLARDVSNPSPLSKTPAYTRNRYQRFAVELRRLLNRGLYRRRGPETVAEWTRAINALGSVGRKAVITTGELDDGIKAELDAAYERAEQAERDRDSARADSERLKELVEGLRQDGKRLAAERDQARAELADANELAAGLRAEVKRLLTELDQVRRAGEEEFEYAAQRYAMADAMRGDACIERDQARAERDAARVGMEELREVLIAADKETTGLREQLERVRGLHRGVCVGACGLDDACECEERDLACDECSASWPCDTIRALDGTEAGR